jgi:predicted nucleic acid-binding protein
VIVVDTSAVIGVLAARPLLPGLAERLGSDGDLHAPHLIDVELLHALRRMVRTGVLQPHRAEEARHDFADLSIIRYPHTPLADRMWTLRDTVTVYDAAFLALAETLDVPLVTCDARLAHASGHRARVELFAADHGGPAPDRTRAGRETTRR